MILYRHMIVFPSFICYIVFSACNPFNEQRTTSSLDTASMVFRDTLKGNDNLIQVNNVVSDTLLFPTSPQSVNTGKIKPSEVVTFAKSLIGVPYRFGSIDPKRGFDCSGFIVYVFNHFKISVPRSSIDFTNVGKAVPVDNARSGDIILFTGTDSTERFVGHMGIVVSNKNKELEFIHSTSGKAHGVTITPLNKYYKGRFVKTVRVFHENDL